MEIDDYLEPVRFPVSDTRNSDIEIITFNDKGIKKQRELQQLGFTLEESLKNMHENQDYVRRLFKYSEAIRQSQILEAYDEPKLHRRIKHPVPHKKKETEEISKSSYTGHHLKYRTLHTALIGCGVPYLTVKSIRRNRDGDEALRVAHKYLKDAARRFHPDTHPEYADEMSARNQAYARVKFLAPKLMEMKDDVMYHLARR